VTTGREWRTKRIGLPRVNIWKKEISRAVQAFYSIYKEIPILISLQEPFCRCLAHRYRTPEEKAAKSLYEKICERYPNSIYCAGKQSLGFRLPRYVEGIRTTEGSGSGTLSGRLRGRRCRRMDWHHLIYMLLPIRRKSRAAGVRRTGAHAPPSQVRPIVRCRPLQS